MIRDDPNAGAVDVLRRCQMPPQEIRWVLTADDPADVHMLIELHVERLREELAERQKALGELEAELSSAAIGVDALSSQRPLLTKGRVNRRRRTER